MVAELRSYFGAVLALEQEWVSGLEYWPLPAFRTVRRALVGWCSVVQFDFELVQTQDLESESVEALHVLVW